MSGRRGVEVGERWQRWARSRPPTQLVHLDSAAAGRSSETVLRAVADHTRREAEAGAYVAESEAAPVLDAGRADLAALLGTGPDGLAFVESASAARSALLAAWPWQGGDAVAVLPSEWGPNLETFAARGLRIVELPADGDGRVDLDRLERTLATAPPAVVHLTQVASHRALVQPVAEAAALCHAAGVPLWVDAAQALGHVDTTAGADAVYATSRKWLAGPRGVGVLAVTQPHRDALRVPRSAMNPDDLPPVQHLESHDAHVAGRVGLCVAVAEHLAAGPPAVRQRLADVGRRTREELADLPGWEVVGAVDVPCAITALRPTGGQDVARTRARLLGEHGILATACAPARAPREMTGPLLRISPHVDCPPEALHRVRSALLAAS